MSKEAVETNTPEDPDLDQFTEFTLEHAEEGLSHHLDKKDIAGLAREIWRFSEFRESGQPKIRTRTADHRRRRFSVLEVVTDDMPFLVASILGQLNELDADILWFGHPIVAVERDPKGNRTRLVGSRREANPLDETLPDVVVESTIVVLFDRVLDPATCALVEQRTKKVLGDVAVVVADWQPLRERMNETAASLRGVRKIDDEDWAEEVDEAGEFLEWLGREHFVILGARDYIRSQTNGTDYVPDNATGLGILRDPEARVLRREGQPISITPAIESFLAGPLPMQITKANVRSTVHRRVYMDYIGVKLFSDGKVIGERRFVGLFTSEAYNRTPDRIPLLRRKVETVLTRSNFAPNSHNRNALAHILETFPRDELFQIGIDDLYEITTGIMRLLERPRPKAFVRQDPFDRFVSVLVFLPRDRYSSETRARIGDFLKGAFDGRVSAYYPLLGDSPLVRVHYIIGRNPGARPVVDMNDVETRLREIVRSWRDGLSEALIEANGESQGRRLLSKYGEAFNGAYKETFTPQEAVKDIQRMESLRLFPEIDVRVHRRAGDLMSQVRVKLYRYDELISLSHSLPVFENMGLPVKTEFSYPVEPRGRGENETIWVHEFVMEHSRGEAVDLRELTDLFETAFPLIWAGEVEDDGFNQLIVETGLNWREASLFRAMAKFLLQSGTSLSQSYMETTLASNPRAVQLLLQYFRLRFDPAFAGSISERVSESKQIEAEILVTLEQVESLDQDRILRSYLNVMSAVLRTNFYQKTEQDRPRPTIAFKLDSNAIESLPLPRPHVEIFVYSPRVEGVHLRFGPIARGGLRWSDRREDFRTEILGLVKAQYVKNSVIVPVGAKGGFVPKRMPVGGTREEIQAEGIACYRLFISSLLDLTDNLNREVPTAPPIRPADTVIHDEADPYLVVAADKGTATFSDIANEIAIEHGFWLGDAFASGGSNGYDHKVMGITARGAWEAVKRHFRELGTDIQTTPFAVVGVGDMSGDVFGNGMLLSRQIKLIAAFDHRDIFLDPDPEPETSYLERERLFALPRSTWADYDTSKISKGGGVFSRKLKSIPLSEQVRKALGVQETALPPQQLMSAILKAQADLLWFGGIGTYVKSSVERHGEVGDAANDFIRVNGEDLQVKVIGEGANLGLTQRARIEFARKGGRINTDAIDNSAGVDCSDHEVNIKILVDAAVAQSGLTEPGRNELLREMTDQVADLVLVNNYDQTLALSLAERAAKEDIDAHSRFMRVLEREGRLNRAVEFLPNDEELNELKSTGRGLTRPEIAVLMAYAKIRLFDEIIKSNLPDEQSLSWDLIAYFPEVLAERYEGQLLDHRLRREIVATELANEMVNFGGLTFVNRMRDVSGAETADVAKAYTVVREVFGLTETRRQINALDGVVATDVALSLHTDVRNFLRRQTGWFLRRADLFRKSAAELITHYRSGVAILEPRLADVQSPIVRERMEQLGADYSATGLPAETATRLTRLPSLWTACDIVDVADTYKVSVEEVAKLHSEIGDGLGLYPLLEAALDLQPDDHWERLAVRRIVEDLLQHQTELTAFAVSAGEGASVWLSRHEAAVSRIRLSFEELEAAGTMTAARFALVVGHVRDLVILAEQGNGASKF